MIMSIIENPFFWAVISMFGLVGASTAVGSNKLGKNPFLGIIIVIIFDLGRFILVFCPQDRFEMADLHLVVGGMILIIGLVFCIPAFSIKPFTVADKNIKLITTGFYGIVRNPIYLGEVLWCLGWAIIFRSTIGIFLVPFWWVGLLFHTLIEEEKLEQTLGQSYLDYKNRVRGRIIPRLPI
jgi:protein-S-isoprenylcysteine O-methyltransferase Ste14